MLTPEEVERLAPHYQKRWVTLGIPAEKAPTRSTHRKILNGQPIQRLTLQRVDEVLAGTDGQWPPGTALALATGEVSSPEEMVNRQAGRAPAEQREAIYLLGGRIMTRLPDATPEQLVRVRQALDAAWRALDDRQGR